MNTTNHNQKEFICDKIAKIVAEAEANNDPPPANVRETLRHMSMREPNEAEMKWAEQVAAKYE
jgi:hypothetical protein